MSRVLSLAEAVSQHVEAGMHLHFSSSPSRSNAAVIEVARQFRGRNPRFTLSTSGFHSAAHLLAKLRLGRRYIACFFGDNYPVPRPNPLYEKLRSEPETELINFTLLSYVEALRAGALGHRYAVVRSLLQTDLGRDLQRHGLYRELTASAPGEVSVGLVRALQPDVTFVHGLLGDEEGNVVCPAPTSEGFWAANGAKKGVIVTVEQVVPRETLAKHRDAMPIARDRVLSVCQAPRGAHPQPLYADPRFAGAEGYPDDFAHYRLWRRLATDEAQFKRFEELVLDAKDGAAGYARFVAQSKSEAAPEAEPVRKAVDLSSETEAGLVLAARVIADKVRTRGYRIIIAGIGRSFFAARLAKMALDREGVDVDVIVETGLVGLECGLEGHEFLLSYENMSKARRISNVEDALGLLACGGVNRCLGVLGAGEIDRTGALNSTALSSGRFLVGSGGAADIAAGASEVVALSRCDPQRMVERVAYVTSPGHKVTEVVTEVGVFSRARDGQDWRLSRLYPALGGRPVQEMLSEVRKRCIWPYLDDDTHRYEPAISTKEKKDIHLLDPEGQSWSREA